MQVFVRDPCTMIAAPVQCDVDGISKRSHLRESIADGVAQQYADRQAADFTDNSNRGSRTTAAADFTDNGN